MPWRIESTEGGNFVVSEQTGKRMNHKPLTEDEAKRYLRALYANEPSVVTKDHSGVVVVLTIPEPQASALAGIAQLYVGDRAQPASEMHITLSYLGKHEGMSDEYKLAIRQAVGEFVIEWFAEYGGMPLVAEIQGTGRFNDVGDEQSALFYLASSPMFGEFRHRLCEVLRRTGISDESGHGFIPHITLAYVPKDEMTPTILFPSIPVSFTSVSLWCGPDTYDYVIAERPVVVNDTREDIVYKEVPSDVDDAVVVDLFADLVVYKTADGRSRWVLYSSNGYEDRQRECVATKALEEDCARADDEAKLIGNKAYGPLRWWHHGEVEFLRPNDWTSAVAGPGADLGMCDFNTVVDGILVESGTFYDESYADVLATVQKEMRASISFSKPPGDPGPERVYNRIRRYERSLVPLRYALPSNRFTALAVRKG